MELERGLQTRGTETIKAAQKCFFEQPLLTTVRSRRSSWSILDEAFPEVRHHFATDFQFPHNVQLKVRLH